MRPARVCLVSDSAGKFCACVWLLSGAKIRSHGLLLLNGDTNMPRYFCNLRFGQRVLSDEEGIELSDRTAARDEALAVVRDLTNPEVEGARRRWASWFIEVADERGGFFRAPIGHPALELVTPDRHALGGAEPKIRPVRAESALPEDAPTRSRTAEIVRQIAALRRRRAELLKENHQLRSEILSLCLASEGLRVRSKRLVSLAQGAAGGVPLAAAEMTPTR
jgi:hypothetical protein